jgi:hypothetical protein
VQQSFIDHGATLSHHHAVGTEHLPWLTDDISPVGVMAVAAIKAGLDPANVMNPGRLRPSAAPFEEWSRLGVESLSNADSPLDNVKSMTGQVPGTLNSTLRSRLRRAL